MGRPWRDELAEFQRLGRARMEQGAEEYGDRSFSRRPSELLRELEEEALDVAGWGFILWSRFQELRRYAIKLRREIGELERSRDQLRAELAALTSELGHRLEDPRPRGWFPPEGEG